MYIVDVLNSEIAAVSGIVRGTAVELLELLDEQAVKHTKEINKISGFLIFMVNPFN